MLVERLSHHTNPTPLVKPCCVLVLCAVCGTDGSSLYGTMVMSVARSKEFQRRASEILLRQVCSRVFLPRLLGNFAPGYFC